MVAPQPSEIFPSSESQYIIVIPRITLRKNNRQIVGTAFVPTDDVIDAFSEARGALPASMTGFADFFEQTYEIARRARVARRATAPRYPRKQWNQHTSALNNSPRTNNATEAWHNRFQVCSCLTRLVRLIKILHFYW